MEHLKEIITKAKNTDRRIGITTKWLSHHIGRVLEVGDTSFAFTDGEVKYFSNIDKIHVFE